LPSEHVTDRDCVPVPHVFEHVDQAPVIQFGHICVLHACDCVNTGHAAPPFADPVVIDRVCVCMPPPHFLEHVDHADQAVTTQLTGHACVLHACCCDKVGHAAPPWAALTTTERVCVWTPLPHVLEQADQADQPPTTQLTGHA